MAKVADAYLRIAEEHPERFVTIDADRPPDVVHQEVRDALRRLLRSHVGTDTPAYGTVVAPQPPAPPVDGGNGHGRTRSARPE
jgi:hypothetical protein